MLSTVGRGPLWVARDMGGCRRCLQSGWEVSYCGYPDGLYFGAGLCFGGGALLWGRGFMGAVYYNGTQSLATASPQLSALSGIISASRLAPLISGFPFSQQ